MGCEEVLVKELLYTKGGAKWTVEIWKEFKRARRGEKGKKAEEARELGWGYGEIER